MIVDDELIILIRQSNEEALMMLLSRYENAMRYVVQQIYSRMRFCGLEKGDLKSVALESFFHAINTYDEAKACFYSYWKLLTERELYSLIKKHDSKSNRMITHALSFDNVIFDEEGCITFTEYFVDETADVVRRYEGKERLLKLNEESEEYLNNIEKKILKKRMEGYTYEEIIACLKIDVKIIERALRKSKKILN